MAEFDRSHSVSSATSTSPPLSIIPVGHLPSVVITKILSMLPWRDKQNAAVSIPGWEPHLHSVGAWPIVLYQTEAEENVYFVNEMRTVLLLCIKKYGKHMKKISINYVQKINRLGVAILLAIAENCTGLKSFKFGQKCSLSYQECNYTWSQSAVRAFCTIATDCSQLKEIYLLRPIIDWSMAITSNVIIKLYQCDFQYLICEMELDSNSLMEHEGYLDILEKFVNLRKLTVRRDKVNEQLLKTLVSQNLRELTLFQDEELNPPDNQQLTAEFWKEISEMCPSFRVNLVFRFIMVIKDSFPANIPLRCLVLDDLVNIVTKGVLDHIANMYQLTLEHFVYINSYIETFETGDRRLPYAIVDLVEKCQKLHSLQYGFPLSSTSVLLIARVRKLDLLLIPEVEVSYEFDWQSQPGWTEEFKLWLQTNGRSKSQLEQTVSEIFGRQWTLFEHSRPHLMNTSPYILDT